MSILYIRLPSKAAADGAEHWLTLPCPFMLASQSNAIERESVAPLSELAGLVASVNRVVLLLAASDVTLLRVKTPPLSAAKLKLALPNLVEDQLMADPAECIVVAGNVADGLRTAAVVQRAWLEILAQMFVGYGARSLIAVPAQLCLPQEGVTVSAAITEQGTDIDLILRLSEEEAMGLPIMPESAESAAKDILVALRAIVPVAPINLYVPQARVAEFQQVSHGGVSGTEQGISVFADSWSRWVAGTGKISLNLMTGLGAGSGPRVNWRPWRWAMALVVSILLINAFGLNVDWWRMKQEAVTLRAAMLQTFKSAYPQESVILDPVAQMYKKIGDAERDAGQGAPDDFGQLAGNFAEVLATEIRGVREGKSRASVITSLEYHDRSLLVHLKPDNPVSTDKMKIALAARNLSLSSPSKEVWQIRSAK